MRRASYRRVNGPALLAGFAVGAGLMFLRDPEHGRRRRSLARDRAVHTLRELRHATLCAIRDIEQRTYGAFAEARSALRGDRVSDEVLVSRVRSRLGHAVMHSRLVEVSAHHGRVTLCGPALLGDLDRLLRSVYRVRGVRSVENRLEVHHDGEAVQGLQQAMRRLPPPPFLRRSWPPATRIGVALAGKALMFYGARRGGRMGAPLAIAGALFLARAALNRPVSRLVGPQWSRHGIDFHKTLVVHAPVEEVYRFWTRFENFPLFMEHVRSVTATDERRSHWQLSGPAGVPLSWDAVLTKRDPNRLLAWHTLPGTLVEHEGTVRFEAVDGGTRLDIHLSYRPLAGNFGHAVATLFHTNPKTVLDEDMIRLKSLFDQGKATAHGRTVTREQLH